MHDRSGWVGQNRRPVVWNLARTTGSRDRGAGGSDLEVPFRQVCHDHSLPQPRVNQLIAGKEVDFLFAKQRLIVETDSWRYHKTRRAFEDDRARDALLLAHGYRTLRITDRALTTRPRLVVDTIAAALADRPAA